MKKIIYILACSCLLGLNACQDSFLNLDPLDSKTDAVYFKTPEHFREYANGLYSQLIGWRSSILDHMDIQSDLITNPSNQWNIGHGTINVGYDDSRWTSLYGNIRADNMLLEKAATYAGDQSALTQYIGEAYFFRAYNYFYLLQYFGGVPILTKSLDTESPELCYPRNSRYEVVDLILSDLQQAIDKLPIEQNIASSDKGHISKQGAKAFKARVLLYEATWRKNVGTKADFEGSAGPASDQVNAFLEECITLSEEVMKDQAYSLWNYNSDTRMNNMSNRYLFCIEDAESNPGGYGRETNKEFIVYSVFDRDAAPGKFQLNLNMAYVYPSRKLMDMFLCKNGLPVCENNEQFGGYHTPTAEYKNRDYRMEAYVGKSADNMTLNGTSGYGNMKFITYKPAQEREESANYSILRLAEVYLNYAEAVMTRYNKIEDTQLDASVNNLRRRANVASLTNALVDQIITLTGSTKSHEEVMMDEIRRERAVELYMEGFRFDDLKRWGTLEKELNQPRCGRVLGGVGYATTFRDANGNNLSTYNSSAYVNGELKIETGHGELSCVLLSKKSDSSLSSRHYLYPIPQHQINLNPNLKQNPGY